MVTKYVEPWVLFPGIMITVLALCALLLARAAAALRDEPSAGRFRSTAVGATYLIGSLAVVLYIVSTPLSARALAGRWERVVTPATITEIDEADAVVVLGGGITWDVPGGELFDQRGEPGSARRSTLAPDALSRLVHGVRIAKRSGLPLVLSGGTVYNTNLPTEAKVATEIALDLGIAPTRIIPEGKSRTTAENARFTAQLVEGKRVVLVTSAYHMARATLAFQRAGLQVLPAPTGYHTDGSPFHPTMLLPNNRALYVNAVALREGVGYLWYLFTTARQESK